MDSLSRNIQVTEPSTTLLGELNYLFYLHKDAFIREARPHEAFVAAPSINRWIVERLVGDKKESSILELASSGHFGRRNDIAKTSSDTGCRLTLYESNHTVPVEDASLEYSYSPLKIFQIKLDLLDPEDYEKIKKESSLKFDGVFATYAMDSIWGEDDITITKKNNCFFLEKYSVTAPEGLPNLNLLTELIVSTDKNSQKKRIDSLPIDIFEKFWITTHLEELDIENHALSSLIKERLKEYTDGSVVIPGTLIKTVERIYSHILRNGGKIILGDIAKYKSPLEHKPVTFEKTGFAYFKYDDWWLAEKILLDKGYTVKVSPVQNEVKGTTPKEWQILHHMPSHYFMEISL